MSDGKRYFEFSEGSSNKFWEVWMTGTTVYTRYGKIGASGQTTVKDEGSADKAQKLYDSLVREKTKKGYQEKGGSPAAPPAKAEAPAKAAKASAPEAPKKAEKAPAPPPPAAAGGTRRFEFTEGGSSKFWEVTVDGSSHTVRYGKIGTPGQEKSKSFGNPAAATADAEKLIKEKTGKGYAEVAVAGGGGGGGGPEAPPLDPSELSTKFAAIDKAPEKPDAYLVFADWLEGQGHPWGKLIAQQHAIATAPNAKKKAELEREETALLQAQGHAILKDLARAGRPTNFEWHYGFITHATIASPTDKPVLDDRLETLFSLPAARVMKKLTLHAQPARLQTRRDWDDSPENVVNPWKGVAAALGKAPATLDSLAFGEPPPTGAAAYVAMPPLAEFAKAMPKLVSLEVQGAGAGVGGGLSGTWGFPQLTTLVVRFAAPEAADLENLAAAKLPKLERLNVWLGGTTYTDLDSAGYDPYDNEDGEARYPEFFPASDLEATEAYDINASVGAAPVAAFLGREFRALKHLGINSAILDAVMIETIANAPLLKQLESLDLSGGTLSDATADALIAAKSKLAHLKALDVSRNRLSKDGLAKLEKAFPMLKAGKQRESGEPEFFFRYVATME